MDRVKLKVRYYRAYPPEQHLGYADEELTLNVPETAFLVVDVYGLGYDQGTETEEQRESKAFQRHKDTVIHHIKPALEAARGRGFHIVYLTNYLSHGAVGRSEFGKEAVRSIGVDVMEKWEEPSDILAFSKVIAPLPDDHLVKKQMFSGFFDTHLDTLLRNLGIRNLVAVGFATDICLGTTLTGAFYRDYVVVMLRDCVGTGEFPDTEEGQLMNTYGIRLLEHIAGYSSTSAEFIQACISQASKAGQGGG